MTAPNPRPSIENTLADHVTRIRKLEAVPPQPGVVQLRPPQMMGQAEPALNKTIGSVALRSRGGIAYRPDADIGLLTGDYVYVDYLSQSDPVGGASRRDQFIEIGARVHQISDLLLDEYNPRQAWQSDPWFGGTASVGSTLNPIGGDFDGYFYCFVGVGNSPGATVHFQTPGGAINANEQYGFDDVTGLGHIGYYFYNFTTTETGAITISFSAGSGMIGYVRMRRTSTGVMLGADLGDNLETTSNEVGVQLTGDVPAGDATIVMTYTVDAVPNLGAGTTTEGLLDSWLRPTVWDARGVNDDKTTVTPHYFSDGRWWPILIPSENRNP